MAGVLAFAFSSTSLPARAAFVDVVGGLPDAPFFAGGSGFAIQGQHGVPFSSGYFDYVNTSGTAVGNVTKFGPGINLGLRAVRWDAFGTAIELGNLGTASDGVTNTWANAINAAGTAVGAAQRYEGGINKGYRAVRWDPAAANAIELPNLGTDAGGFTSNFARAINAGGTIIGDAEKYAGGEFRGIRAVRWENSSADPVAVELGDLGTDSNGVTATVARSINDTGTTVGFVHQYADGVFKGLRAVRWASGGTAATELGNLGTDASGTTYADAEHINASGDAVGNARKYDAAGTNKGDRPVRWNASGTAAIELETLGLANGSTIGDAYAINDAGMVAGYVRRYDAAGTSKGDRAVRWDAAGAVTELGHLGLGMNGGTSSYATDINAAGFAVGYASKYTLGNYAGDRAVYWDLSGAAVDLNTLIDPNSGWVLREATAISDGGWIQGHGMFDPDGPGPRIDWYYRFFTMRVPATAVPEPSSATTMAAALFLALARRTRRVTHHPRGAPTVR